MEKERVVRLLFSGVVDSEPEVVEIRAYTGRVVKGLAAECSPLVKRIVEERKKSRRPKPFAATPLFRRNEERLEALYPGGPRKDSIRYPRVRRGDTVFFELGLAAELADEEHVHTLIECLESRDAIPLRGLGAEAAVVTLREVSLEDSIEWVAGDEPLIDVANLEYVKLVFASPTLPVNPWQPFSRHRPLLPDPAYIFSVNAFRLYPDDPLSAVRAVDRSFYTKPGIIRTVRLRWYVYGEEKGPLPSIAGYGFYWIDEAASERDYQIASALVTHAALMGVGSGRATGFGVLYVTDVQPRVRLLRLEGL